MRFGRFGEPLNDGTRARRAAALVRSGLAHLHAGSPQGAEQDLYRAMLLQPDDATVRGHLSLALFRQGRFEEAEREVQDATSRGLSSDSLQYMIGLLQEARESHAGGLQGAGVTIRSTDQHQRSPRALVATEDRLQSEHADLPLGDRPMRIGEPENYAVPAAISTGREDPAAIPAEIARLREAVAANPGDARLRRELSILYLRAGRLTEAKDEWRLANPPRLRAAAQA